MGQAHWYPKNIVQEPMVEDNTEERFGDKHWIDRTESAIFDASPNVAGKKIVKDSILLLKKHGGQLMPFQGTRQEQAKHRRICTFFDLIAGEQCKEPFIISFVGCGFDGFSQL